MKLNDQQLQVMVRVRDRYRYLDHNYFICNVLDDVLIDMSNAGEIPSCVRDRLHLELRAAISYGIGNFVTFSSFLSQSCEAFNAITSAHEGEPEFWDNFMFECRMAWLDRIVDLGEIRFEEVD